MKTPILVMMVALAGFSPAGRCRAAEASFRRESAAATLASFEATLDGVQSATVALGRWCAGRRLATPAVIHAERVLGPARPADPEVRHLLDATPGERIGYRRVRLVCGDHVLSEADNWYRPGRLSADMNRRLETTDQPFGAVVRALDFHRLTLAVEWLYDPLTDRNVPREVLRHRAVLATPDGEPFSLVVETYTADVLMAGPPDNAPNP